MDILKPLAQKVLKDDLAVMQESINKLSEAVGTIRSEERGWINVSQSFVPWETTGEERQRVIEKLRDVAKKNPMAGRIVDIKCHFTMGQGVSFKAEDPDVNEVLKQFWTDESNKWFQRQSQLSDDIEIDGEFYLRFFTNDATGRVQVRNIPAWQITDVITDQEDTETPLFYKREWVEQKWDKDSKLYQNVKYHTGAEADFIPANEILHVKVGSPLYAKFGHSPLYRVLSWLNAYKEWLEDRVKINKAKSAFAWKKKIKSIAGAIGSAVSNVLTTLNKVVNSTEPATPPKTGSVIVENEGIEWTIVNSDVKADSAYEDGRAIKLMIVAGSGIYEHWFGDSKISTKAGADSMDLPMLRMFEWRQKMFEEAVFRPIFRRVIRAAIEAGTLPEKIKVTRQEGGKSHKLEIPTDQVNIDIDFPPLVLKNIKDLTEALVKQVQENLKSNQTAAMELGVEDWEMEKVLMAAEAEEQAAKQREDDTNKYPPFNQPNPQNNEDDEAEDDMMPDDNGPDNQLPGKKTPGKKGTMTNGTAKS